MKSHIGSAVFGLVATPVMPLASDQATERDGLETPRPVPLPRGKGHSKGATLATALLSIALIGIGVIAVLSSASLAVSRASHSSSATR